MTTAGPNDPSSTSQSSSGKPLWSNTGNVAGSNNSYATASLSGTFTATEDLRATNYGFSIPGTATIDGITLEIERKSTTVSGTTARDSRVFLTKNGTATVGSNKAMATAWPSSDTYATYGGAADLWGTTWTPSDINSSNFGVILAAIGDTGFSNPTASVDHIRLTVDYTDAGGVPFTQRRIMMGIGI
jgi:hypothetical protein